MSFRASSNELEAENAKLKQQIAELEEEAKKEFSPRERNNLLGLLVSVVLKHYRYNPFDAKSSVGLKLETLARGNVHKHVVTGDVISKKLKEGAKLLSKEVRDELEREARERRIS